MATDPLNDPFAYAERFNPRTPAQPQPASNDDPVVAEIRRQRALQTFSDITGSPPADQVARVSRVARDAGLPPGAVDNPDQVEQSLNAGALSKVMDDHPAIGAHLAANPRTAVMAQGDHKALGMLGLAFSVPQMVRQAILGDQQAIDAEMMIPGQVSGALKAGTANIYSGIAGFAQMLSEGVGHKSESAALRQQVVNANDYAKRTMPQTGNWFADQVLAGISNAPSTTLAMAGGLAARGVGLGIKAASLVGAATGGISQGGQSYTAAREQGASYAKAATYAGIDTATEIGGEYVGKLSFLHQTEAGGSVLKRFLKSQIGEQLGEQFSTVAQDISAHAMLPENRDKTLGDLAAKLPGDMAATTVQTLVAGGIANLTIAGLEKSLNTAGEKARAAAAARAHQSQAAVESATIDALGRAAQDSKLRGRDPVAYNGLVAENADHHGVQAVYVPATAAQAYMQSDSYDQYTDPMERYRAHIDEAAATGGDVVLPPDFALGTLPGTKAWEALKPDMRLSAGGLSSREADDLHAHLNEAVSQIEDTAAKQAAQGQAENTAHAQIVERVRTMLQDAGFTPDAATKQAELIALREAVRAARMGRPLTGNEFSTQVQQVLPPALAAARAADATDLVINALRKGKPAEVQQGQSLLQFIADRGGVEDKGGDLAAMGAGDWHMRTTDKGKRVPMAGRKKLLKPFVEAQGNMIGGAHNPNSMESMFDAAVSAGYFPDLYAQRENGTGYADALDLNDFKAAIADELAGRPRHAAEPKVDHYRAAADELATLLGQRGIDPAGMSDAELRGAIDRLGVEQSGGYDQAPGPFDFTNPGGKGEISGQYGRDTWVGDTNISYSVKPNGIVEIGLLKTRDGHEGAGSARGAMEQLIRQADAEGKTLALTSEPMNKSVNKARLTAFYKSLGFVENKGKSRNFETQAGMIREPRSYNQADPATSEAFKAWSGNADVVRSGEAKSFDFATGKPVVVEAFHGTARPDRVSDTFRKDRASAGPMSYFTSSPELASKYATSKNDTSIDDSEFEYGNWFKVKVGRKSVPADQAFLKLDPLTRSNIRKLAPRVTMDWDTDKVILGDASTMRGNGGYDPATRDPLKGLVEAWLTSGALYDREDDFLDVLKLAGVPPKLIEYDNPHATAASVFHVWVSMKNPLYVGDIPADVSKSLDDLAANDASTAEERPGYQWDKRSITPRDWVAELRGDHGTYAWTRIPDAVTELFKSHGYDGIVDYSGKGGGTEMAPVYIPFEETQVKAINNRGTFDPNDPRMLNQTYGDGPRGRIIFDQNRPPLIQLFQQRNMSTLLHEISHQWLEELRADAEHPDAPDQVKADWQTVQDWFHANGHVLDQGIIPVEAHEMFARTGERYLMEGKAPSSALTRLFETFRGWMLAVYKTLDKLRSPISPEIREVFDRLLATDDEIQGAREREALDPLFKDAASIGMTGPEHEAYMRQVQGARDEANSALLAKTMAAIKRRETKAYNDERNGVRDEESARLDQSPILASLRAMKETPISKEWLTSNMGEDVLDLLPKRVPPLWREGGVHPDEIAEEHGFGSGQEMIETLIGQDRAHRNAREAGDKRTMRDRMIDQATDAEMKRRHGDDPFDNGAIEREALAAVNGELQGEVMATELRVLARKSGKRPTPYAMAREWARGKVRGGTVAQEAAPAAIQRHARNVAKAGREAEHAMMAGKTDEAFAAKQRQMLSSALLAEAKAANDDVTAAQSRMAKVAKAKTMKSVDQDYLEQAQSLLEAVDLRPRSQRAIDRQAKWAAWAEQQRAAGHDVVVPDSYAATLEGQHWSRMSVEGLLGLDEAVQQVMHLGRFKQTLLDGKERRDFDQVVQEAVNGAGNIKGPPPADLASPDFLDSIRNKLSFVDAALLKLETIFDWLDGGNPNGVFNRIVFRPLAKAQAREQDMLHDYYGRIKALFEAVPAEQVQRWNDKTLPPFIDRFTGRPMRMDRQQVVAMALNIGNEGNLQRLTDGYGINAEALQSYLNDTLTAEEWQFVQGVWDTIDTLWPEIEALERRVNGVAPDKVEARGFTTPHGEMRGGYYPAVYDTTRDRQAGENADKASDLFAAKATRANTRASSTKARAEKVSRPLNFDLGVINRHLGEVIHDMTHREAVMQAWKFLSSSRIQSAVDAALGHHITNQFKPWVKFIANSWAMDQAGNEGLVKIIRRARTNTTMVGMGFRATTIISQVAGYTNSMEVVGAKAMAKAMVHFLQHPVQVSRSVLEKSDEVRQRMDTMDRDIKAEVERLAANNPASRFLAKVNDGKQFAFHFIGLMDRVVSIPTWLAGYNNALEAGASEEDAIYAGDKAVRVSQGAGAAKDLAAVQRGTGALGEAGKLLTMFYSFNSMQYQRERTLARDAMGADDRVKRVTPRLMARATVLFLIGPLLTEVMRGVAGAPAGPDDDEWWAQWVSRKMLANAVGPIPVVRDVFEPSWNKAIKGRYASASITPVQRALDSIVNVFGDVGNVARGEPTKHATKNALELTGYATGLVPGQIASATQFLVDWANGDADPQSAGDVLHGLSTGHVPKH